MEKKIIQVAEATSLNSHKTIYYSQKLDKLITIHQKISCKKETRKILLNDNRVI
ncbi:Spo0E family sporulation regulatory protein-aspartic acid phosphatase [Bacillus sp. EB600]|uniref:Spo0E family sporulation regulatory protein-aspartic acid phosphatase n=1 Tax=Bacillus sp. EB600 TaxID=2806345 RepID=UPI0035C16143|nr:Spo0E family sporulation regulatory protein-aspartic acid phosphatase [Bacillus sp. EB600]